MLGDAGFRDIEVHAVPTPLRTISAAECVRFERESFGALHQMLAGLEPAAREDAWREIEDALRKFEPLAGSPDCARCSSQSGRSDEHGRFDRARRDAARVAVTHAGVEALVQSPRLATLRSLWLRQTSIGAEGARAIAAWEGEDLGTLAARHGGNLTRAARAARMDRAHLRELLRKHGKKPLE